MIRKLQQALLRAGRWRVRPAVPTPVFPDDAPAAHASGPDALHVLLVGGAILRGWGVRTHDLALPGHLARALADRTGRGVDVALSLTESDDIESTLGGLAARNLSDIDIVVLHVGVDRARSRRGLAEWQTDLDRVLLHVRDHAPTATPIAIGEIPLPSGLPALHARIGGIGDVRATRLNDVTETICAAQEEVFFLPMPLYDKEPTAAQGRGRPDHYRFWAAHEADVLVGLLKLRTAAPQPDHSKHSEIDASRRADALQGVLQLLDTTKQRRIDNILRRASTMFGVDSILFTTAGTSELTVRAASDRTTGTTAFAGSFCAVTLTQRGTVIISDTSGDSRIDPRLPGRFYAGHPIVALDGTRIGAVCVVASDHPGPDIDPVALRDLALQVQDVLHGP